MVFLPHERTPHSRFRLSRGVVNYPSGVQRRDSSAGVRTWLAPVDLIMAVVTAGITVTRMLLLRRSVTVKSQGLVVLDASYTLDQVHDRELQWAITARDCDGLFDHVWSVHPMVGADGSAPGDGPLRVRGLSDSHTFIEAHMSVGPRWNRLPITGFVLSQIRLLKHLRQFVVSGRVSAVRVGDPYYLGLLGYLLAICGGLPLTVRVASDYDAAYQKTGLPAYPRLFRSRRIEKRIERYILRRAELIVAPNLAYQSFAIANGARPERCAVVPFGGLLHPAHFDEPSDRHSIRDEVGLDQRPLVVSVMRLEPVKHAVDLVGVLDLVRRDCPNVVFAVVGDGSQRGEMLARTRELGLDGSLFLLGNRGQRWIASLLADADVIAAPMMGRALVEAALSGTPIVAYDVDWHGELIDDGETGVLVPFGDREAMARAILRMLDDPDYVVELGSQARRAAMDAMSREVVSRAEREAWLRVLPLAGVHVGPRGSRMPDDDAR